MNEANQALAQKEQAIRRIILEPMMDIYQEPQHVRGKPEELKLLLTQYLKALSEYNERTIEMAWERVKKKQRSWSWPSIGVITDACDALESSHNTPSSEASHESFQEMMNKKKDAVNKDTNDYVHRFMTSMPLAEQAVREGWDMELRDYVWASADFQAHCIHKIRNKGISYSILCGGESSLGEIGEQRIKAFFHSIKEPIERGQIGVSIPSFIIEYGRQQAEYRKARHQRQQSEEKQEKQEAA